MKTEGTVCRIEVCLPYQIHEAVKVTAVFSNVPPLTPCALGIAAHGTHTTFGVTQTACFDLDRDTRSSCAGPAAASRACPERNIQVRRH